MKKIIIIIALALTSLGSISSLYAEEILDDRSNTNEVQETSVEETLSNEDPSLISDGEVTTELVDENLDSSQNIMEDLDNVFDNEVDYYNYWWGK